MPTIDLHQFQQELNEAANNAATPRERTIKRLVELLCRLLPLLDPTQRRPALLEALSAVQWLSQTDSERLTEALITANADARAPSAPPAPPMREYRVGSSSSAMLADLFSGLEPTEADLAPSIPGPCSSAALDAEGSGGASYPWEKKEPVIPWNPPLVMEETDGHPF